MACRVMVTVSGAGGVPWWCSARLSGQLDILRLITRGQARWRRGGSRRSVISVRVRASARVSRPGGKCRLGRDLAAHDPQGPREGEPVGIKPLAAGGLVHQLPDGVVHQEE